MPAPASLKRTSRAKKSAESAISGAGILSPAEISNLGDNLIDSYQSIITRRGLTVAAGFRLLDHDRAAKITHSMWSAWRLGKRQIPDLIQRRMRAAVITQILGAARTPLVDAMIAALEPRLIDAAATTVLRVAESTTYGRPLVARRAE
jgi:hypothetical protein